MNIHTLYLRSGPIRFAASEDDAKRLGQEIRDQTEELARLRSACSRENDTISQVLGGALGYPRFADDQKNFPGSTDADGVCVGDHVAASLADEAASVIGALRAEAERLRADAERYRWIADKQPDIDWISDPDNRIVGRYVICRCDKAGVHAGVLVSQKGDEAVLRDSRRLWSWCANAGVALSGVAVHGLNAGKVDAQTEIALTGVIETIPCSAVAEESIRAAK